MKMVLRKWIAAFMALSAVLFLSFSSQAFSAEKSKGTWYDNASDAAFEKVAKSYSSYAEGWINLAKNADGSYTKASIIAVQSAYNEAVRAGKVPGGTEIAVDGMKGTITSGIKELAAAEAAAAAGGGDGSCFDGDCTVTETAGAALNTRGTIADPEWTFSPAGLSPSKETYDAGPKGNFTKLLAKVTKILLVAIAALAALLIAAAGARMAFSSGNTDEASKGKTMLRFNIMALAIALLSYAILNFVSWIVSA